MAVMLHYAHNYKQDALMKDYISALCAAPENKIAGHKDTELTPDTIVCIHWPLSLRGLWQARRARRHGSAVVAEPHGCLSKYMLRHEGWLRKHLLLMIGTRRLLNNADAVVALTADEAGRIKELTKKARTTIIPTEIYTTAQTPEAELSQWQALEQKVTDSRAPLLTSAKELTAISTLVAAALARKGDTPRPFPKDQLAALNNATQDDWRRLMLTAEAEGVLDLMRAGAVELGIDMPDIDTTSIDRFAARSPKYTDMLPADKPLQAHSPLALRLKKVCREASPELKVLCTLITNAHTLYKQQRLSLRALASVYDAVLHTDYDEDEFCRLLKRLKLRSFGRRIIGMLAQMMQLDEGYWPIKPKKPNIGWLKSRG